LRDAKWFFFGDDNFGVTVGREFRGPLKKCGRVKIPDKKGPPLPSVSQIFLRQANKRGRKGEEACRALLEEEKNTKNSKNSKRKRRQWKVTGRERDRATRISIPGIVQRLFFNFFNFSFIFLASASFVSRGSPGGVVGTVTHAFEGSGNSGRVSQRKKCYWVGRGRKEDITWNRTIG